MYLVYKPEGSEEPQRWKYNPRKLMSAERESIERITGCTWADFTKKVVEGSSLCRRALLYTFLKRANPPLKLDDVDFAWDELELAYSKGELTEMREAAADSAPAEMRAAVLARIDEQIAEAFEDPDEKGKAQPPIAE